MFGTTRTSPRIVFIAGEDAPVNDPDLQGLEHELTRLPDVSIARVVADPSGGVAEIHIVALPGKPPKQIVRDVESVALASFGLRLDRRAVSVVQPAPREAPTAHGAGGETTAPGMSRARPVATPATSPGPALEAYRPILTGVDELSTGGHTHVTVTLDDRGRELRGTAEGSIASVAHGRIVAEAVLDALAPVTPTVAELAVDTAHVIPVGRCHVAVVVLAQVDPPAEHQLAGTAVVRAGRHADALARAVLDATNRRLGIPA